MPKCLALTAGERESQREQMCVSVERAAWGVREGGSPFLALDRAGVFAGVGVLVMPQAARLLSMRSGFGWLWVNATCTMSHPGTQWHTQHLPDTLHGIVTTVSHVRTPLHPSYVQACASSRPTLCGPNTVLGKVCSPTAF